MSEYVYGLRKNTRRHPVYGEVGVLYFLHKPAHRHDRHGQRMDSMREGKVRKYWEGRPMPAYVMHDKGTTVYRYHGGCLWCDYDEGALVEVSPDPVTAEARVGA